MEMIDDFVQRSNTRLLITNLLYSHLMIRLTYVMYVGVAMCMSLQFKHSRRHSTQHVRSSRINIRYYFIEFGKLKLNK